MSIKFPAFGETGVNVTRENKGSRVFHFAKVTKKAFDDYCVYLTDNGCTLKESFERDGHFYAAFCTDGFSYFLNFYEGLSALYIVEEKGTLYFEHECALGEIKCTPQITQIFLEDFGLSYVIRLSDGRFIIFDGGWDFEPDAIKLYNCLKAGANGERPRIAAWILTHAHRDHFECFVGFMNLYGALVDIDALYYNFPEGDDIEHFPSLAKCSQYPDVDNSAGTYIGYLNEKIKEYSLKVYTPHTGQTYQIADARCEVLSSMDDTIHATSDMNATSLIIRMELAGQVILWAADASCSATNLAKKHGKYLKSDILQIPHHGFGCGKYEAEIEAYELILPETCFMPVAHYHGIITFSTYKPGTRHVITMPTTKEVIVGDPQRTITLPYTPKKETKAELEKMILSGIDRSGSHTWVFSELNTANPDDLGFTILNMTQNTAAVVLIELFFTDKTQKIRNIRVEVEGSTLKQIRLDDEELDSEWCYHNPQSLKNKGIVPNSPFAARFMSNVPVVITNKNRKADYYSQNR